MRRLANDNDPQAEPQAWHTGRRRIRCACVCGQRRLAPTRGSQQVARRTTQWSADASQDVQRPDLAHVWMWY